MGLFAADSKFNSVIKIDFRRAYGIILLVCLLLSQTSMAYSPYSTRELDELEKEFVQQINQSSSVLREPLAVQYINHLAKTLAGQTSNPIPYFFIVKSNEINAFAGPGGYIGVNTQLILATANESELAAVMAHEMAHVRLHHLYRMLMHQKQMRIPMLASLLASIALGAVNPTLGSSALMASLSGFTQDSINYTRSSEKEADRIGIDMLIKSGLDPRGMAGFFKKMQQHARYYYTAHIPAILRTHPLDEDRIAEAENRSQSIGHSPYTDSLNYRLFKELVRTSVGQYQQKLLLDFYRQRCRQENSDAACHYGEALTLLNMNQHLAAQTHLLPLLKAHNDNLYYQIAMAEVEEKQHLYQQATKRLRELYSNYPEHYAVIIAYADSLLMANNADVAISVLLKAHRQFKADVPVCERLAQAYAASKQKNYAYFTFAQCELIQGRKQTAMAQLKLAQKITRNDAYLTARISAKIEEIKYLSVVVQT